MIQAHTRMTLRVPSVKNVLLGISAHFSQTFIIVVVINSQIMCILELKRYGMLNWHVQQHGLQQIVLKFQMILSLQILTSWLLQ